MLIVFEGLERVGKSTQLKLLAKALRKNGQEVVELHTSCLNGKDVTTMKVESSIKFFLYMAAVREATLKIKQAISEGKVVLVDRYICSNIAFATLMPLPSASAIISYEFKNFTVPANLTVYVEGKQFGKDWLTSKQRTKLREEFEYCLPEKTFRINNKSSIEDIHKSILNRVNYLLDTRRIRAHSTTTLRSNRLDSFRYEEIYG